MLKFLLIIFLFLALPSTIFAQEKTFFPIQSIDTMKISRDEARNATASANIPQYVEKIASMSPTHIAISTPYDEEFYSVLSKWVEEARKHNLKVWFRGNFSGWEGWFSYPRLTSPAEHHQKTYAFITAHPELFEEGDIFTPAPEPENGIIGDPRDSEEKKVVFLQFLQDSYSNCQSAFNAINKHPSCGYFSTNGDVAKYVLTPEVVQNIGNRVVIDHYVKTPEQLVADINLLYDKFQAPIVLGEIGVPIPDIHGSMTEQQQADYIHSLLIELLAVRSRLEGLNYWTAFGGTTAIFSDKMEPRLAEHFITQYFNPITVSGFIQEKNRDIPLEATVSFSINIKTQSDKGGHYSLLTTSDFPILTAEKEKYVTQKLNLSTDMASKSSIIKDTTLLRLPQSKDNPDVRLDMFSRFRQFFFQEKKRYGNRSMQEDNENDRKGREDRRVDFEKNTNIGNDSEEMKGF
jgi:hypothetical protein